MFAIKQSHKCDNYYISKKGKKKLKCNYFSIFNDEKF